MEITDDFYLEYGQRLILKKPNGYSIVEFSRHPDKDLDNIIEKWTYDSRKKSKGESAWIIEKDFLDSVRSKILSYPDVTLETKPKKSNKG